MKQLAILTFVLGVAAGCSGGAEQCVVDDDCFRGELCIEGSCARPTSSNNPTGDAGTSSSDDGGTTAGDMSTGNDDARTDPDAGTSTSDSGSESDGGTSVGSCTIDPFDASCQDDDNDSFADYVFFEDGAPGCESTGDDVTPASSSVLGAQLCALEQADKYTTNLVPCDNRTFVLEVTVTPKQPCRHDDYAFNVWVQGKNCDEPSAMIRCEDLPDGAKKVTAFVEPSSSLASANIDIEKADVDNAHFDYDLTIEVRE